MADSFSWSYKRRYKTGYVWQDLLDDDLITPISDNEFVLKGSEIFTLPIDSFAEKESPIQKPEPVEDKTMQYSAEKIPGKKSDLSCNPTNTEKTKVAPFRRTVTFKLDDTDEDSDDDDDYDEEDDDDDLKPLKQEPAKGEMKNNIVASLNQSLRKKKKDDEKGQRRSSASSFSKTKSYNGASHLFRNLLTCGAVETNDSAMMPINRCSKEARDGENKEGAICRTAEVSGGSQRRFGGPRDHHQQPHNARGSFDGSKSSKKCAFVNQKAIVPNCSQCGKSFKPEKLHAHMKSCRAFKSRGGGRGGANAEKPQHVVNDELTTRNESSSGLLLTHSIVV